MPTSEQIQANRLTPTQLADMPDDTLISLRSVLPMIQVSRTTLWRMINAGQFPQPIRVGTRLNRWHLGAVREVVRGAI
jgi:predicted DNA-binding transcriptional regulator AlpA